MRKLVKLNQTKNQTKSLFVILQQKNARIMKIDRKHEESFSTLCVFFKVLFFASMWRF